MDFLIKVVVSALLIAGSSELAKRFPGPAGIVVALPVTSLIALFWIYRNGASPADMSAFLLSVGWITISGLALFFVTPIMFNSGFSWKISLLSGFAAFLFGTATFWYFQKI